jgi:hypothetical protein
MMLLSSELAQPAPQQQNFSQNKAYAPFFSKKQHFPETNPVAVDFRCESSTDSNTLRKTT